MATQFRNFETAVSEKERQDTELPQVEFQLNGKGPLTKDERDRTKTHYQILVPDEDQIGLYVGAFGGRTPKTNDILRALLDLFETNMPTIDWRDLNNRVLDPDDPVGIETLQGVMEWLMEEATGFPTQPQSDSNSSGSSTGRSSTGSSSKTASPSSGSRRVSSATSSTRARSRR
jgi:hypothetical protein